MNGKLILLLSMFGLAMGIATVYVIPSQIEPWFWLVIFVVCAFAIARGAPGKPFYHGLLLGIVNSVWVTGAHVILYGTYMAHHAREAEMMRSATLPVSPRLMMACVGPIIGVISGVVIGLFALLASWLLRRGRPPAAAST